ncbi:GH92 family glycosyl hydrolase [Mucilaginibacter sp. BJC16-A38]|uniref:GH92 family glycosyl hydrolase n=1 Tax=Mucilaginibacter phenanthrenivorans TaxID=1234842 RepID=UPI002157FFC8|nr:GH92 family glycosyl hydrolase [Mucilaginibacter phenanthrenivorans]MCR8558351.1 GH92 family glycosyl hydrolase [Mucilaginibacter phenanthrenivorans]
MQSYEVASSFLLAMTGYLFGIMKKLTIYFTLLLLSSSLFAQSNNQYVDPFIGTSATGHTFPGATVPFGMVQLSPETGNFGWNYCSGYRYEDTTITGFAHTHLSGTGGVDLGDVLFFPFQGDQPKAFNSKFSKSTEKASPGYYTVVLSYNNIKAELTASAHTGVHRYTYLNTGASHLLVDLQSGLVDSKEELETHVNEGSINITGKNSISGYASTSLWVDKKVFFVAHFSKAFKSSHFIDGDNYRRLVIDFDTKPGETIEARVAISAVSIDGANKNLTETINKSFDVVKADAAAVWGNNLGKLKAEGTKEQKITFYTSLYHALIQPNNIADIDGKYRGADGLVHQSADKVYYSTLSLWDTYRAAHPLYTIICPERDGQMVETMLQHFNAVKLLPIWALWGKESYAMIGNHAVPVMVDASLKGIKGFDKEKVFAAIKTTLTIGKSPKYDWNLYMHYGYLPSDTVKREAVSRTMEAAYDDWCAAQLARLLHKTADYNYFIKRSKFYTNLFDKSTNLERGRLSNGDWVRPFANLDSGQLAIGGDYTEGNAWQYVWQVQQDIPGLIKLMGDKKHFSEKLDSLFTMDSKVFGKGSTLDVTGLIGQYAHGNEPNHHVAYLYTEAGNPAKTQQLVRQIIDQFYLNKPDGLSGNDDCGQMSAWYLFSAMGFYPVNPADGRYIFGAPQLDKITIVVPGKKAFIIEAKNLSAGNKYVQSITLNGVSYTKNYITHRDIMNGGKLVFVMGDKAEAPVFLIDNIN